MNVNTFERKTFLNTSNLMKENNNIITTTRQNNYIIVNIDLSRATANEAEQFKQYLGELTIAEKDSLIINLSKATFIDSTFLSVIVSFNKNKKFDKEKIKLIVKDYRQSAILRITKIDAIFKIYSTLEEVV